MLEEHPHKLQLQVITPEENDEYNRPIPETGGEYWQDVTDCFCHDNSQQKEVSVNGERWVYNYHVVYEGKKIILGSHIRCLDTEEEPAAEMEPETEAEPEAEPTQE